MTLPTATGQTSTDARRPTTVGAFNLSQPGTSARRAVPVPWIDCAACSWRHYPSTERGLWYIATTCVACGADLQTQHAPA